MATINPYLTFNGTCEVAFNFYKPVFGGDFPYAGKYKDMPSEKPVPESEKIMHISSPISKETVLMGSDSSEAFGKVTKTGDNFSISVNTETETEEEAHKIFNGLSAGGKITMPLNKTFWNAFFGMFTDKFGINRMVNYEYNKK